MLYICTSMKALLGFHQTHALEDRPEVLPAVHHPVNPARRVAAAVHDA